MGLENSCFVNIKNNEICGALLVLLLVKARLLLFTKSNIPTWVFFTFLNCVHGTKSRKVPHI